MNEEILAGLKMAKERGSSPEDAVKSFINAGYNVSEVREAAAFLLKGFSPLPTVTKEGSVSNIAPASTPLEEPKEMSDKTKWIIVTIVALVVVSILMSLLLFKEQFLSVVDSIFP